MGSIFNDLGLTVLAFLAFFLQPNSVIVFDRFRELKRSIWLFVGLVLAVFRVFLAFFGFFCPFLSHNNAFIAEYCL